jgi:hypothetical protein
MRRQFHTTLILVDNHGNPHRSRRVLFTCKSPVETAMAAYGAIFEEEISQLSNPTEKNVASVLRTECANFREHPDQRRLGSAYLETNGVRSYQFPQESWGSDQPVHRRIDTSGAQFRVSSETADALLQYRNGLHGADLATWESALLRRLYPYREYASAAYTVLLAMHRIGSLEACLKTVSPYLRDPNRAWLNGIVRVLELLLRYEHATLNDRQLGCIEGFAEQARRHDAWTGQVLQQVGEIRAHRITPAGIAGT